MKSAKKIADEFFACLGPEQVFPLFPFFGLI
jgi:hypothetical protein